ncbi:F-box domain-containing protein [Pleurotus pulmonarius]
MLILYLPPEIIDQIVFLVEKPRDLLALALTCSTLSNVVIPYHIDYRDIRSPLRSNLWDHLIHRNDLANRISRLFVHDDPELHGLIPFPRLVDRNEDYENESKDRILLRVCDALSLMKNLVSLDWELEPPLSELNPETTILVENVWPTIKSSTSLRHLHLPYPAPWIRKYNVLSNPLWLIANLTSLTLDNIPPPLYPFPPAPCIASLLRHSPRLEKLCLNATSSLGTLPDIPLPCLRRLIFRTCIRDQEPLSLSPCPSLSRFLETHPSLESVEWLDSFPALLDDHTLPSLRHIYGRDSRNGVENILNTSLHQRRPIESLGQLRLSPMLFAALSNIQPHSLRKVDISHFPTIEDIVRLADMFPAITWLRVPAIDYRNEFSAVTTRTILTAEWPDALSRFQDLEVFHGVSFFLEPTQCEENLHRAEYLHSICPRLREVDHWDNESSAILELFPIDVPGGACVDAPGFRMALKERDIEDLDDRYAWREPFD